MIATSGVAYAGQTVDKFGSNQSIIKSSGVLLSTYWLDKDGQELPFDAPLTVMQGKPENFKFMVFRTNGLSLAINFGMSIIDPDYNLFSDPELTLKNTGYCKFDINISKDPCDFKLIAKDTSTVGQDRLIMAKSLNPSIANSSSMDINIIENNPGGTIIGTGPSHETNILTAMAISQISANDKESFTLTIDNLKNVKTINLAYQIEDTSIAQFESLETKTQTCNVDATGKDKVECTINVIPLKTGNTKITFLNGKNTFTDINNNVISYESSQLKYIKVNIGTLYAGYLTGNVFRKGSSVVNLGSNVGVKSLAIDGQNHRLFAISGNKIYQQNNISNSTLQLDNYYHIPDLGGTQDTQTLSLTNESNTILIGTGKGKIYSFNPTTNLFKKESDFSRSSVISGDTDTMGTKYNYFVDDRNNFAVRNESNQWIFNTNKNLLNGLSNLHVSAHLNDVYVAADIRPTGFVNDNGGSELLHWENESLVKVSINNTPFKNGNYIITLFNDGVDLFAGASYGKLYKLNKVTFEWILFADIKAGVITDIAIDKNKNIYLSAWSDGVYKINRNNPNNPLKLDEYSDKTLNNPVSLVIDNNLQ